MGGLTVQLNLGTRLATVVIDGLGKRSLISGRWRHYKLKRRNLNMSGLQVLLRNPFRGTFKDPLQDGWVEHGTVVHRHTDPQNGGGFALNGLFHIINIFHGFHNLFEVDIVEVGSSEDEDVDDNENFSDDEVVDDENNSDIENNN